MILMTRPDGGHTWVHESRVDEYTGRGFRIPSPARAPKPEPEPVKKPAAKKKTAKAR